MKDTLKTASLVFVIVIILAFIDHFLKMWTGWPINSTGGLLAFLLYGLLREPGDKGGT